MRILYRHRRNCLASLPQGLIAYYKLNDTTNTIIDSVGGFNFTNNGATLGETGILHRAVGFDGTSGKYIGGTSAYAHQTYDDVTVSLWYKPNSVTGISYLYVDQNDIIGSPLHVGPVIRTSGTGIYPGYQTYNSGGNQNWGNYYTLQIGVWVNITITINRAANTFTSYVNGNQWPASMSNMTYQAAEFLATTSIGSASYPVNGVIDDVKIWNRALTLCEVKANYNDGLGTDLSSPFKYGKLYNGYVLKDARGIAPSGWHIPTDAEWRTLCTTLDPDANAPSTNTAGGEMKETGTTFWTTPNSGATNSSKFNARAHGVRSEDDGSFFAFGANAYFWNSREITNLGYTCCYLVYNSASFYIGFQSDYYRKYRAGIAIRLIKDNSTWNEGDVVTDIEGNVYPTIKIGDQVWMAANYKCGRYNNGDLIAHEGANPGYYTNAEWAALTTGAWCWYDNDSSYE